MKNIEEKNVTNYDLAIDTLYRMRTSTEKALEKALKKGERVAELESSLKALNDTINASEGVIEEVATNGVDIDNVHIVFTGYKFISFITADEQEQKQGIACRQVKVISYPMEEGDKSSVKTYGTDEYKLFSTKYNGKNCNVEPLPEKVQ